MKNEALRLFLASAALLLTALLANPISDFSVFGTENSEPKIQTAAPIPLKSEKKIAKSTKPETPKKKPRASRTFAFFYRR